MSNNEPEPVATATAKVPNDVYEAELFRLQTEFVKLQEWTRSTGARIVVVFCCLLLSSGCVAAPAAARIFEKLMGLGLSSSLNNLEPF